MGRGRQGRSIRRLTEAVDPRLYRVVSIAAPTEEERAHHYLWRFWRHLPRDGRVTIFDRSWYGRVLVERVEGFATPAEWERAYLEINDFEEQLVEHGVVIVKYWLHISPREQLRRFRDRQRVGFKRHKITSEDWRNRKQRVPYDAAVSDMVARTDTPAARWTLVAGDDKKVARLSVLEAFVAALAGGSDAAGRRSARCVSGIVRGVVPPSALSEGVRVEAESNRPPPRPCRDSRRRIRSVAAPPARRPREDAVGADVRPPVPPNRPLRGAASRGDRSRRKALTFYFGPPRWRLEDVERRPGLGAGLGQVLPDGSVGAIAVAESDPNVVYAGWRACIRGNTRAATASGSRPTPERRGRTPASRRRSRSRPSSFTEGPGHGLGGGARHTWGRIRPRVFRSQDGGRT